MPQRRAAVDDRRRHLHAANWVEREAFDWTASVQRAGPDLAIATDSGFACHPFRKHFPLSQREVKDDPAKAGGLSALSIERARWCLA